MTERAQAIFDRVAAHLLKQNARSMRGGGVGCAYRGEDGLSCAVGCLITDKHYRESFEGLGVGNEAVIPAVENSLGHVLDDEERDLLCRLQGVHDGYEPNIWPEKLRAVGQDCGLTTGKLVPA